MTWTPGRAKRRLELEEPFTDVPPHLSTPLLKWLEDALSACEDDHLEQIVIENRLSIPINYSATPIPYILITCKNQPGLHLDMIESVLEYYPWSLDDNPDGGDHSDTGDSFPFAAGLPWSARMRYRLDDALESGNSAYRINSAGDGLELRLPPGVMETVSKAVQSSPGSAGDHLTSAWNAAYGRTPEPSRAYGEAVKAVECALAPIVSPKDAKATLGKMITNVHDAPAKWRLVDSEAGVLTILAMMRTLWTGQTRHGGLGETKPETQEEAVVALHLAAALVQFGSDGEFRSV